MMNRTHVSVRSRERNAKCIERKLNPINKLLSAVIGRQLIFSPDETLNHFSLVALFTAFFFLIAMRWQKVANKYEQHSALRFYWQYTLYIDRK